VGPAPAAGAAAGAGAGAAAAGDPPGGVTRAAAGEAETGGSGDPYYPPGFSNKNPSDGVGASVSYSYDGTAIPDAGYPFEYTTTEPRLGNGSGTIKNS